MKYAELSSRNRCATSGMAMTKITLIILEHKCPSTGREEVLTPHREGDIKLGAYA